MKSYTDILQSKKLAEILPLESADMYYAPSAGFCTEPSEAKIGDIKYAHPRSIRCWSLAALLNVLPYPTLYQQGDGAWGLDALVEQVKPYSVKNAICEVDACVEMIIKLHEEKLL